MLFLKTLLKFIGQWVELLIPVFLIEFNCTMQNVKILLDLLVPGKRHTVFGNFIPAGPREILSVDYRTN